MSEWPMLGLWGRGKDGFVCVDGEPIDDIDDHDPGPWLVPKDGFGGPYAILRRRRALLREFTDLGKNASQQRILAFANKWGRLGVRVRWIEHDDEAMAGESFGTWRESAVRLAMLTGLWQRVKAYDSDALADFVDWYPERVMARIPHVPGRLRPDLITIPRKDDRRTVGTLKVPGDAFELSVLAHKERDPNQLFQKWRSSRDPVEPMRYYVCREVNEALKGHINRAVLPHLDNSIRYVPDSLLACVYVAFQDVIAGAVAGERECLHCGMPFTATRRNRVYCNDNCAKRAWDKRQA